MDKKSVIAQRKNEKPKNQKVLQLHQKTQKNVVYEKFKIDNSDFPSLDDVSVKTSNQNKTSQELNKASFSYSDKLKAPAQERTSNFFKFGKESNDFNKNESSPQSQLSLPKNNFSQNKNQVQKSSGANNNDQTDLATGRSQIPNKCIQQENFETSFQEEDSSDTQGWTLYHKNSSTKQRHDKFRNNPERNFRANYKNAEQKAEPPYPKHEKFHNSTVKNPQPFDKSSKESASKPYETTSAKDGRSRLDMRKEVLYSNNAKFNKVGNNSKANSEGHSASSSTRHPQKALYREQQSNDRNRTRSQNEMLPLIPINQQQMHNRNHKKYASSNSYPSTSLSQSHPDLGSKISSHQHPEQISADSTLTKTKKKRKSKVKRQAALQTGKILILTPEVHLKILNQANSTSMRSQSNAVTNIDDDEEYPELGIGVIPKNNNEIPIKSERVDLKNPILTHDNGLQAESSNASTSQCSSNNVLIESAGSDFKTEKVISTEAELANVPVHSSNQITVSLFDMLLSKKSKKKEIEDKVIEEDKSIEHSPVKVRTKKVISQPVNPLASSKPTVKRGKEREQPKAKKPSKMRKLILMGRKIKKESMVLKDTEVQINDQSDFDTDTLSDGSTLSPSKSPVYGELHLHGYQSNYPAVEIDGQHDILNVPNSSCKKMLFTDKEIQESKSLSSPKQSNDTEMDYLKAILPNPYQSTSLPSSKITVVSNDPSPSCSYNDVTQKLDPQMNVIGGCKTLVSNAVNENYVIYSNDLDQQETRLVETLDLELRGNVEINIIQRNILFENRQELQAFETQDQTSVKNKSLDVYFDTLIKCIFDDCMAEIRSRQTKVSSKKKAEIVNFKEDKVSENISTDIVQLEIPDYSRNEKDNCNNLGQTILASSLPEMKILQSENVSCSDLPKESTSEGSSLSAHMGKNIDLLPESVKDNVGELSESNFCDTHVTVSTNTSEKSTEVICSKVESSCALNSSSVINSECDFGKLDPLSQNLEKSVIEVNTEFPHSKFSDQEKMEVAKILLHTRRFRDYCTHFVNKELDMTVFTLLDDLARFQDRMHQKDPVKARVKRRLMYGIKEIKKHLTLKKLKGIIIATDIEDNKTEGGLNDILKELISLAEAYHIPYVFSHKRFNLGKVCRKPAPVSCVGILNYEGSEKNFKKMLELQEESHCDYTVITKKIVEQLTDDHITSLLETVQKSIIPYEISKIIMNELFANDLVEKENKASELTVKPEIASLELKTKVLPPVLKPDKNCTLIEDYFEKDRIYTILKKYNVIKT